MAYEIRVVFQTLEAYQSAVERLYGVLGVGASETLADVPLIETLEEPEGARLEEPEGARLEEPEGGVGLAPDPFLDEDPDVTGDGYSFTVEDRTR